MENPFNLYFISYAQEMEFVINHPDGNALLHF